MGRTKDLIPSDKELNSELIGLEFHGEFGEYATESEDFDDEYDDEDFDDDWEKEEDYDDGISFELPGKTSYPKIQQLTNTDLLVLGII